MDKHLVVTESLYCFLEKNLPNEEDPAASLVADGDIIGDAFAVEAVVLAAGEGSVDFLAPHLVFMSLNTRPMLSKVDLTC